MTNKILVNRFLSHLRQEGKSVNTLSAYATDLRQLSVFIKAPFSSRKLGEELNDYILSLANLTPNSQARKVTSTRKFLSWLHQQGYLKADLAETITLPKRKTKMSTQLLSTHQIARLRRAASLRERLILELVLQTGMKITEVVTLRTKHINLKKLLITNYQLSRPSGRGFSIERSEPISIPITDPLKQTLDYYLAAHSRGPRSALLVSERTGRELTSRTASNVLAHLAQKAGVRGVTPRNLRTTFIVRQLEAGTPIATVQEIVGHETLATTQKYLEHVSTTKNQKKVSLTAV